MADEATRKIFLSEDPVMAVQGNEGADKSSPSEVSIMAADKSSPSEISIMADQEVNKAADKSSPSEVSIMAADKSSLSEVSVMVDQDNIQVASYEETSRAFEVIRSLRRCTSMLDDEQKAKMLQKLIEESHLCLIEDAADLSSVLDNSLQCILVINSTSRQLIDLARGIVRPFKLYNNADILSHYEMASPKQFSHGLEVIRSLRFYQVTRDIAESNGRMLFEYSKVMLLKLFQYRTDLHTPIISQLLQELKDGSEKAYRTLVKSSGFLGLKKEVEQAHTVNKELSEEHHIRAKELIRDCRVCVIEDGRDLMLLSTNGMKCSCLVSLYHPILINQAIDRGFEVLLY